MHPADDTAHIINSRAKPTRDVLLDVFYFLGDGMKVETAEYCFFVVWSSLKQEQPFHILHIVFIAYSNVTHW